MTPKMPTLKSSSPTDIFAKLFEVRDAAHIKHLSSKSYSEHVALNGFYDDLLGLIDGLVESYQGKYGILTINIPQCKCENIISMIESMCKKLENQTCCKDSWILNQLDEIITLGYSTLYKLKNLK